MTTAEYFRHTRSLAPFPANQALALARAAVALDEAAAARKARYAGQDTVAREVMPDGSAPIHLSFGVKVF
jgi:hypothetical protein